VAEREPSRTAIVAGIAFVVAGVAFLLERLDVWDLEVETLLPAALIGLGLVILLSARTGRRS
jgi:hypothetical protein